MGNARAAQRYAKAILDLAVDKKAAEKVEKDMHVIADTIKDSKELRDMLVSPVLSNKAKKDSLAKIFGDLNDMTQGLIGLMVDNKRASLLYEVATKYIILNEQLKGKSIAYVTTAVPMTPVLEKKVLDQVQALTGNEVSVQNRIDESLIGGFVLRVGDLQYDASIANKLNNLKREFKNSL